MRRLALRMSTLAGGLAIGIVVAEVLLRLVGFQFNYYPTKVQIGWPDPIAIKQLYQVDKDLLWVTKDYATKTKAPESGTSLSMVFMGCSCTEFGEYDTFFAELIRQERPGIDFSYRNLGIGGWTSFQGLQQFKRDVIPLKPRIVTIYYGWNDHWCTFGLEDKQIWRSNLEHSELMLTLLAKSRVVQLVDKAVFARTFKGKASAQRVSLADFRANLAGIVRLARENGIVPILLTAPSSHQPGAEPAYLTTRWLNNLSDLVPLHESYVQAVRDVAAAENVDLLDLYGLFRALPAAEFAESFQGDGIHLTEPGDRRIARFLNDNLVETGLISKLVTP